ncbi:MAG: hypothetical protein WBH40_08025 [Ignavibacteriaceae bacterium]|jgi:hypothetical protein
MEEKINYIEVVINSLYKSISFQKNERPDLDKLKELFLDEARLIRTTKDSFEVMSVAEFISNFNTQLDAGAFIEFREYEIKKKIEMFGGIAHVFSTYQTDFETEGGRLKARGINSIQLIEMNNEWKVVNIFWYTEDEANKVPEEYLP